MSEDPEHPAAEVPDQAGPAAATGHDPASRGAHPPADGPGPPPPLRRSFRINARGWIYLILTVSVAFAAGFKGNNLLFAVFCVLLGIFAASGALTWAAARRMEVSRLLPESVSSGEMFTLTLRIRNGKRIWPAFCLRFGDQVSHDGRPDLLQPTPVWLPLARPGQRVRGTCYLTIHQRGWVRLGPVAVVSEFTPGLFTCRTVVQADDRVLVYPKLGVLHRRILDPHLARIDSQESVSTAHVAGDEEFAGLRDYRPGDSPRRIHWKMSARLQGRLLVKDLEDPRLRHAVVLLDTYVPNPNDPRRRLRLERAVTFAGTLVAALLADRYRVRFRAFAPDPVDLNLEAGRGAMDDLLRVLAELRPSRTSRLADLGAPGEGRAGEVFFVLRIGSDEAPAWVPPRRALSFDVSDMRDLMLSPE